MHLVRIVAASLSLVLASSCGPPCQQAVSMVPLQPVLAAEPAPSLRYNQVFGIATHNSYWVQRDPAVEIDASGVQERILDQLLIEHARGLEIDAHFDETTPHQFTVYHTNLQTNSFCTPLDECMKPLRLFHYALPRHEPVTVVIELKELVTENFDAAHTPADLDSVFTKWLHDPDGKSWLFTPHDLMARCPGATTLRECVQQPNAWPLLDELRGKFLIVVIGNYREGLIGHGPEGWVDYAKDNAAVNRIGFPMESNWIKVDGRGTNANRPAAEVKAAQDASVFLQVETLNDPRVPDMLAHGIVVRGHDSFSYADQNARIAAGFQLIQTDYPWFQTRDAGPARALRPFAVGNGILEPGARLFLSAPNGRTAFAGRHEAPGLVDWETLPSTTRATPCCSYPAALRPRGNGCLRATTDRSDDRADSVTVCRRVIDGEYTEISVVTVKGHKAADVYRKTAPAHRFGPGRTGDLLRLRVDTSSGRSIVDAYSASDLGDDGLPAWVPVAHVESPNVLAWQGLAGTNDVLFVHTLRNGSVVRATELAGDGSASATLTDLTN